MDDIATPPTYSASIDFARPTGEYEWVQCPDCRGDEGWYDDAHAVWVDCETCGGRGGWRGDWHEYPPDQQPPLPTSGVFDAPVVIPTGVATVYVEPDVPIVLGSHDTVTLTFNLRLD